MNSANSSRRRGQGTVPQETFLANPRDTERYHGRRLESNQGQSPGIQQSSYHARTLRYQMSFPEHRQFDTDSMYRMPPSEPIYLDIDPTIVPSSSRRSRSSRSSRSAESSASRSPGNSRSMPAKPYTSRQPFHGRSTLSRFQSTQRPSHGKGADLRRFNPYGSYSQPVSPREITRPQPSPSLIMFGDDYEIGSVNTGSSQQSLLQRRRDVKKRREKKYSSKKKKKKERIVSIPSGLLTSSRDASMVPVGSSFKGTFYEKPINNNSKSPKKSQWMLPRLYCSPDDTGTTESSTQDMIGEDGILEVQSEARSVISSGEHSFPLLSTNAAQGLSADVEANIYQTHHPYTPLTNESQSRRIDANDDSANQRPGRRIRFAADLEQRREIPLPYYESNFESDAYGDNGMLHTERGIPEKTFSDRSLTSDRSPTSVTDIHTRGNQSSFSADPISPRELFNKGFKPKSILRNKRHDKQGRISRGSQESSYAGHKGRFSESSRRSARLMDPQRVSTNSPPPVFLDASGRELSPIRTSSNQEDFVVSEPDLDDFQNILTPKSLPEDDSGNSVDAFFIHSVAAIVVQTAVRRFLAMQKVQRLRTESLRQTPKRGQGTQLSSKQDFQDMQQRMYYLAAVQIQSAFRGWWVRDSISVDTYCVTLIQKVFRGFRARMEYLYDVFRITLVQSICRRWLAIKLCHDIKTEIRIRSRRSKSSGHRLNLLFGRLHHAAATTIQATWRAHHSRWNFILSLSNIILVQSVARRWLAIKQEGSRLSWGIPRGKASNGYDVHRRVYSNSTTIALEHGVARDRTQTDSPVKRSQVHHLEGRHSRMWGRSIDDENRSANHEKHHPAIPASPISNKDDSHGHKTDPVVATLEAFRRTRTNPTETIPGIQQNYSSETFNTYEFGNGDASTSGVEHLKSKSGTTAATVNINSEKHQDNVGKEFTNDNRMTSQKTSVDGANEPSEQDNSDDPGTTRSLLNSWKLKEKQNAFTIQPRKNLLQK